MRMSTNQSIINKGQYYWPQEKSSNPSSWVASNKQEVNIVTLQ